MPGKNTDLVYIATLADFYPEELPDVPTDALLSARTIAENLRLMYKGQQGLALSRKRIKTRISRLDAELRRRGITNPMAVIASKNPHWQARVILA